MAKENVLRKICFNVLDICEPPGPKLSIAGVKSFVSCLQRKINICICDFYLYIEVAVGILLKHFSHFLALNLGSEDLVSGAVERCQNFQNRSFGPS